LPERAREAVKANVRAAKQKMLVEVKKLNDDALGDVFIFENPTGSLNEMWKNMTDWSKSTAGRLRRR
jgi:sarcosine oxidase delta subunit